LIFLLIFFSVKLAKFEFDYKFCQTLLRLVIVGSNLE
jgi:hypothetical protein